jgi:hypothetical protein
MWRKQIYWNNQRKEKSRAEIKCIRMDAIVSSKLKAAKSTEENGGSEWCQGKTEFDLNARIFAGAP